jgi:hypothetical protein
MPFYFDSMGFSDQPYCESHQTIISKHADILTSFPKELLDYLPHAKTMAWTTITLSQSKVVALD